MVTLPSFKSEEEIAQVVAFFASHASSTMLRISGTARKGENSTTNIKINVNSSPHALIAALVKHLRSFPEDESCIFYLAVVAWI